MVWREGLAIASALAAAIAASVSAPYCAHAGGARQMASVSASQSAPSIGISGPRELGPGRAPARVTRQQFDVGWAQVLVPVLDTPHFRSFQSASSTAGYGRKPVQASPGTGSTSMVPAAVTACTHMLKPMQCASIGSLVRRLSSLMKAFQSAMRQ